MTYYLYFYLCEILHNMWKHRVLLMHIYYNVIKMDFKPDTRLFSSCVSRENPKVHSLVFTHRLHFMSEGALVRSEESLWCSLCSLLLCQSRIIAWLLCSPSPSTPKQAEGNWFHLSVQNRERHVLIPVLLARFLFVFVWLDHYSFVPQ